MTPRSMVHKRNTYTRGPRFSKLARRYVADALRVGSTPAPRDVYSCVHANCPLSQFSGGPAATTASHRRRKTRAVKAHHR